MTPDPNQPVRQIEVFSDEAPKFEFSTRFQLPAIPAGCGVVGVVVVVVVVGVVVVVVVVVVVGVGVGLGVGVVGFLVL